jgi:hypothetical protein
MSFGIKKATNGAPVSGRAQQLASNSKQNKDNRGTARPGQGSKSRGDTKAPGK